MQTADCGPWAAAVLAAIRHAGCAGPQPTDGRTDLSNTTFGATTVPEAAGVDAISVLASLRHDEMTGRHTRPPEPTREVHPSRQDIEIDPDAQRAYMAGSLARLGAGATNEVSTAVSQRHLRGAWRRPAGDGRQQPACFLCTFERNMPKTSLTNLRFITLRLLIALHAISQILTYRCASSLCNPFLTNALKISGESR